MSEATADRTSLLPPRRRRRPEIMAEKRLGARPVSRQERILDADTPGDRVGNGSGARGAGRRRNTGATKHPPNHAGKRRDGDRRIRGAQRREERGVSDVQRVTKTKELFNRSDRTKRHVIRKSTDNNRRTEMTLPISLTKTRGKKARVIGVDDHVSGVAAQRRQLGGAARGRQRKKKSALPLGVEKVQRRRQRRKDGKRR